MKEWQIFELFSQKGEKTPPFVGLKIEAKGKVEKSSSMLFVSEVWVSLEIFAVGQGNGPSD